MRQQLVYVIRGRCGDPDDRLYEKGGDRVIKTVHPNDVAATVSAWHAKGRFEVTATPVLR